MSTTNTVTKENLIKIKELINDPTHWTQRTIARNKEGALEDPLAPDAVCFCLLGAAIKVSASSSSVSKKCSVTLYSDILHSIDVAVSVITDTPLDACHVSIYNDTHTHAEVLALLDKAIALCD